MSTFEKLHRDVYSVLQKHAAHTKCDSWVWDGTQGTVLRVDIAVIICYFVMGDAYAKNCKAKK